MDDPDPEPLQQGGIADPRELQQLRRIDRARAQQNFAVAIGDLAPPVALVFDAGGACAVEQDPARLRLGNDREIGAATDGCEIGARGAASATVARGQLIIARPFLHTAIEIRRARHARLDASIDEGVDDLVSLGRIGDMQRPIAAVIVIPAARLIFAALEIGQNVVIAPAAVAALRPMIEILRLPADIDHTVDRARSAQHLAARPFHPPPGDAGIGFGFEAPIDGRIVDHLEQTAGDVNPRIAVGGPRFEQQHAIGGIGAQAVGQHASRRTGPDDDIVERRTHAHWIKNPYCLSPCYHGK